MNEERMILNITMKFHDRIPPKTTRVKEWIDDLVEYQDEFIVGSPTIVNVLKKFDENKNGIEFEKHVQIKLNVPIEYDEIGHRKSPISVAAKYMENSVMDYQYGCCRLFRTSVEEIKLDSTCLKYVKYVPWEIEKQQIKKQQQAN